MTINYKQIADNDPGGEITTAFETMESEKVDTTPPVYITYKMVAGRISFNASSQLETIVLSNMPAWFNNELLYDGVNINNSKVKDVFTDLLPETQANLIIALGVVLVPKYKGLRKTHLVKARLMRTEGRI